jgi:hypothetical protein
MSSAERNRRTRPVGGSQEDRNITSAKWIIASVELSCPICGGEIPSPTGSLFWTREEMGIARDAKCQDCGMFFAMPRIAQNH